MYWGIDAGPGWGKEIRPHKEGIETLLRAVGCNPSLKEIRPHKEGIETTPYPLTSSNR